MGEVYRARDCRLGRIVALKVLPERLSQNVQLRQRLEHEARTISKLSHPNICTLHDIGHDEGMDFLVLEFVEGPTLRRLIGDGIPPMRNVISIGVQIAEGLAKLPPLTTRYTRIALTQKLRRIIEEGVGYGLALEGISAADVARAK